MDAFHATTTKSSGDSKVIDIDEDGDRLLSFPDIAPEIFENSRGLERKKMQQRKLTRVDKRRGYYIDWFVDIVEELEFSKETLYYVVRYFSGCLMGKRTDEKNRIYSTKYNFSCEQIVDMEKSVLKTLGYDLSSPTTWSFMERFMRAAQGGIEFRFVASYIAELSLYSYNMKIYLPSMVAASSVFLAKYVLQPLQTPRNPTLRHHTLYEPCNLQECVMELQDIAIGRR